MAHIIFEGEHFKGYRVTNKQGQDNNWSNAIIDFNTVRGVTFDFNDTDSPSTCFIADDGYKITDVTFALLMESGGEYYETGENGHMNGDYPLLENYNGVYGDFNATLSNGSGSAFKIIAENYVDFKVSVTTESYTPTPPDPPEPEFTGSNIFPDGVPTGYTLHSCTKNGNWSATIGDVIDVSQLNYSGGEVVPNFALVRDFDNFDYTAIEGLPYLTLGDNIIIAMEVDYVDYAFLNTDTKYTYPAAQVSVSDLPVGTPIGTVFHTVTLDRSFCTADSEDSVQIEDDTGIQVTFTPVSGYQFNQPPYTQLGETLIEGEILADKTAKILVTNITENITITAVCVPEGTEPVDTGLVFTNVYNPTFSQLKEAADALFINFGTGEAINLQQYIVSVHKLFCPVPTNELSEQIKFGRYNTGVSSKVINSTTTKVSCGKVTIPEKWHNSLDYTPYTTVKIWLPFLGFFDLSIDEIMEEEIELTYTIDILSGKALAELTARGNVVYRFVGTAKSEEPYYVQSGQNISQAYINGAYNMADFTPYLLLERPMNLTPSDTHLQGLPTYRIVTIGDCTGYIQCEQVFAVGMTATDEEKQEIESLLKQGVLVD